MSLVFRRVNKISKRARKSRSRTRKTYMDTSEHKPLLLVVDDEHFPSLNAVYKADIFGTPIDFHRRNGWDMCGLHKHKVLLNSITFMKEYCSKSFDELRWEDYQCNRKNSFYFQERSYLKCLSNANAENKCEFELIQPTKRQVFHEYEPNHKPMNDDFFTIFPVDLRFSSSECLLRAYSRTSINDGLIDFDKKSTYKHFPLVKTNSFLNLKRATVSVLPIISEEIPEINKETKPRSILTNVGKSNQVVFGEETESKYHNEDSSDSIQNSNSRLNSRQECIDILRNKLIKYFDNAEPAASIPYDFISQNQKYYLPCASISFVYQNARPSRTSTRFEKNAPDSLPPKKSYSNRNLNRLEQLFDKHDSNHKAFETHLLETNDIYEGYSENKYTPENEFNMEYFWKKIDPYFCGAPGVSKAKNYLLGKNIVQ